MPCRSRPHLAYGSQRMADKYTVSRYQVYRRLLMPYVGNGVRVLELGCYAAELLDYLPPYDLYYVGLDIDRGALRVAKNRHHIETLQVDLNAWSLPFKAKFDVIVCTETLEHLRDPEKILIQFKELLSKQGVILLSLPNEVTILHRIRVVMGKGIDLTGFDPLYHMHFPTIQQSLQLVSRHFEVITIHYYAYADVGGTMGKLLSAVPTIVWEKIANLYPSLFARGVMFLARTK